ncbi:alpha/beta hydrolase fold domain-containing protein [Corynebacterium lizhenjunii]|uniref:Alpha/beta hydrolase fold domain-containing protein n=1 Tax=Corynebacterium lizhenjunii TaxID=2709394 RepID=A0A7T0KF82_9CORY|nr:alpha/beta hydrolase fold domain-containing protein [Corynebacterium lizhenjunii]QPK79522.1 alpha/beta hydrolase fold domain-containing protein [Corynebacterium lizhenjunii]
MLDPQLRAAVAATPEQTTWDPPLLRRRGEEAFFAPDAPGTRTVNVPGACPVLVQGPVLADALLLTVHGGGFVAGRAAFDQERNRELISAAHARGWELITIGVDYSLSPEAPYPRAAEELAACVDWARRTYPGLPLVLLGDSAGAGLIIHALDRSPLADAAVLLEPVVSPALDTPSWRTYADGPVWTRRAAQASWQAYLTGVAASDASPTGPDAPAADLAPANASGANQAPGDANGANQAPANASGANQAPANASGASLAPRAPRNFPPTLIIAAAHDPLRDEAFALAGELTDTDVPTELLCLPGTAHGTLSIPGTDVWARVRASILDAIERAQGPTHRPLPD